MRRGKRKRFIIIHSLDEIPDFQSEDEEREWWASHDLSEELYDRLEDTTRELDELTPLQKGIKRRAAS